MARARSGMAAGTSASIGRRMSAGAVISVEGLRKSYGQVEAVRGIDLEVGAGEIFAFLGPNGAGKTTTCEILEGYRRRDAGEVRPSADARLGRAPSVSTDGGRVSEVL